MNSLHVGVLCGGFSNERDVSLQTGKAIHKALLSLGHNVTLIDVSRTLLQDLSKRNIDVCYNALHGTFGEDGQLQSILDFLQIPYTGENRRTSMVAFDKKLTKLTYEAAHVKTPRWLPVDDNVAQSTIAEILGFPLFAKPIAEGSSVGVELIESEAQLAERRETWRDMPYLLEQAVSGAELSVACWDDAVLGSVEIVPKRAFYDYEAKYGNANTEYFIPPRIPDALRKAAEEMALAAHRALGCESLCRTDVMVNEQGAFVLETNTLPGMTESSLVPKIAAAKGIEFPQLIALVLAKGYARHRREETL